MPVRHDEREYRGMSAMTAVVPEGEKKSYRAHGYATTFDVPYVLFERNGVKYYEVIDSRALDGADMSDVIMQYDHRGRVLARTGNGSLTLHPDEHGLMVDADLSMTSAARELHEDIQSRLVTKMSWAFKVREENYDNQTRTRTITKISKVYDVSAVSTPANDDTDISARSYVDGVIERTRAERLLRRRRILKLMIDTETEE